MRQTIRYAKVRASQDPDRGMDTPGTYYGSNAHGSFRLSGNDWAVLFFRVRTTHGAYIRAGVR